MAKQLLDINKFQNGTVTTPDATDTPEQSATYSINLDCVHKDGALQGSPINAAVTIKDDDASTNATPDIDKDRVANITAINNISKPSEWFIVKQFTSDIDRSLDSNLVIDPVIANTRNTNQQFINQSILLKKNNYFVDDIVKNYGDNNNLDGLNKLYEDSNIDAITWLAGQENTNGIHRQIILVGDNANINKNFVRRTEDINRKNNLSFARRRNTKKRPYWSSCLR